LLSIPFETGGTAWMFRSIKISKTTDNSSWRGSNGSRIKLWKAGLHNFSNEISVPVTVCHFPPRTNK